MVNSESSSGSSLLIVQVCGGNAHVLMLTDNSDGWRLVTGESFSLPVFHWQVCGGNAHSLKIVAADWRGASSLEEGKDRVSVYGLSVDLTGAQSN